MLSVHLIVPKVSLLPQYFSQKETKKPHCIAKDKSKLYIAQEDNDKNAFTIKGNHQVTVK